MIDDAEGGRLLAALVQIARTFRQAGRHGREQGLAGTSYAFLQCLRRDESARLSALATRHGVSVAVASRTADTLEERGYISRRADPADGRAQLISITDAGRAHLEQRESAVVATFTRALADWSPARAEQAIATLDELSAHLRAAIDPTDRVEPPEP